MNLVINQDMLSVFNEIIDNGNNYQLLKSLGLDYYELDKWIEKHKKEIFGIKTSKLNGFIQYCRMNPPVFNGYNKEHFSPDNEIRALQFEQLTGIARHRAMVPDNNDTWLKLAVCGTTGFFGDLPFVFSFHKLVPQQAHRKLSSFCEGQEEMAGDYLVDKKQLLESDTHRPAPLGRDTEIRSIFETLLCDRSNNVLLTGLPGVGKSAIIHRMMLQLMHGEGPRSLHSLPVLQLDYAPMLGNAASKMEAARKLYEHFSRLGDREVIVIIEDLHYLCDKNQGLPDAFLLLREFLRRDTIRMVASCSQASLKKVLATDESFLENFRVLEIMPPDSGLLEEILLQRRAELQHKTTITISPASVTEAIRLSQKYLPETALPSSAIRVLEKSVAGILLDNDEKDTAQRSHELLPVHIAATCSALTGIPVGRINEQEYDKLTSLETNLKKRVIGQDHAVKAIVRKLKTWRMNLSVSRTAGSFFLLGPTGTGKTELAKALADNLFDDPNAFIRFDMSEFKEEHSAALLIGSPPGYVGYEAGGVLVNKIRQKPYAVVLFDEIEKAHHTVFDLFLQIMDEGKLHDKLGFEGDFTNAVILFTSNIASDSIRQAVKTRSIDSLTQAELSEMIIDYAARTHYHIKPEFLGRLSAIIPFDAIGAVFAHILELNIYQFRNKLLQEKGTNLEVTPSFIRYLLSCDMEFEKFGARKIRQVIQSELIEPVAEFLFHHNNGHIRQLEISYSAIDGVTIS